MPGCPQSASASGAEREPGEMQACPTPARMSSSTRAEANAVLRLAGSISWKLEAQPLERLLVQLDPQSGAVGDAEHGPVQLGAPSHRGGEEKRGREAVGDARVGDRLSDV